MWDFDRDAGREIPDGRRNVSRGPEMGQRRGRIFQGSLHCLGCQGCNFCWHSWSSSAEEGATLSWDGAQLEQSSAGTELGRF